VPQPEHAAPGESQELFLTVARLIGQRTAEMHRALATPTDNPAFAAEPVTQADLEAWLADTRAQAARGFAALEQLRAGTAETVAGMLRSFDYAAWAGVFRFAESDPAALEQLLPAALGWRSLAQAALTEGYREAIGDAPSWPADKGEADRLVRLFTIQKIFYEVAYEAANRPAWLRI